MTDFLVELGTEELPPKALKTLIASFKETIEASLKAEELSFSIAQKIQDEMQYPGHIKVTVIREKRAISFAK